MQMYNCSFINRAASASDQATLYQLYSEFVRRHPPQVSLPEFGSLDQDGHISGSAVKMNILGA